MPSYTVAADEHGVYAKQLTATTIDTVTFSKDLNRVEIVSDGSAAVYVTVDASVPAVAGQATFEMPAGGMTVRELLVPTAGNTVVKLISTGTPKYSVAEASS